MSIQIIAIFDLENTLMMRGLEANVMLLKTLNNILNHIQSEEVFMLS